METFPWNGVMAPEAHPIYGQGASCSPTTPANDKEKDREFVVKIEAF